MSKKKNKKPGNKPNAEEAFANVQVPDQEDALQGEALENHESQNTPEEVKVSAEDDTETKGSESADVFSDQDLTVTEGSGDSDAGEYGDESSDSEIDMDISNANGVSKTSDSNSIDTKENNEKKSEKTKQQKEIQNVISEIRALRQNSEYRNIPVILMFGFSSAGKSVLLYRMQQLESEGSFLPKVWDRDDEDSDSLGTNKSTVYLVHPAPRHKDDPKPNRLPYALIDVRGESWEDICDPDLGDELTFDDIDMLALIGLADGFIITLEAGRFMELPDRDLQALSDPSKDKFYEQLFKNFPQLLAADAKATRLVRGVIEKTNNENSAAQNAVPINNNSNQEDPNEDIKSALENFVVLPKEKFEKSSKPVFVALTKFDVQALHFLEAIRGIKDKVSINGDLSKTKNGPPGGSYSDMLEKLFNNIDMFKANIEVINSDDDKARSTIGPAELFGKDIKKIFDYLNFASPKDGLSAHEKSRVEVDLKLLRVWVRVALTPILSLVQKTQPVKMVDAIQKVSPFFKVDVTMPYDGYYPDGWKPGRPLYRETLAEFGVIENIQELLEFINKNPSNAGVPAKKYSRLTDIWIHNSKMDLVKKSCGGNFYGVLDALKTHSVTKRLYQLRTWPKRWLFRHIKANEAYAQQPKGFGTPLRMSLAILSLAAPLFATILLAFNAGKIPGDGYENSNIDLSILAGNALERNYDQNSDAHSPPNVDNFTFDVLMEPWKDIPSDVTYGWIPECENKNSFCNKKAQEIADGMRLFADTNLALRLPYFSSRTSVANYNGLNAPGDNNPRRGSQAFVPFHNGLKHFWMRDFTNSEAKMSTALELASTNTYKSWHVSSDWHIPQSIGNDVPKKVADNTANHKAKIPYARSLTLAYGPHMALGNLSVVQTNKNWDLAINHYNQAAHISSFTWSGANEEWADQFKSQDVYMPISYMRAKHNALIARTAKALEDGASRDVMEQLVDDFSALSRFLNSEYASDVEAKDFLVTNAWVLKAVLKDRYSDLDSSSLPLRGAMCETRQFSVKGLTGKRLQGRLSLAQSFMGQETPDTSILDTTDKSRQAVVTRRQIERHMDCAIFKDGRSGFGKFPSLADLDPVTGEEHEAWFRSQASLVNKVFIKSIKETFDSHEDRRDAYTRLYHDVRQWSCQSEGAERDCSGIEKDYERAYTKSYWQQWGGLIALLWIVFMAVMYILVRLHYTQKAYAHYFLARFASAHRDENAI